MSSSKYIYVQASDPPGGCHCLSLETGEKIWWFDPNGRWRGLTPAIDQIGQFVYFNCNSRLFKLNAITGAQLDVVAISSPANVTSSGNTILVNDVHGYFIAATYRDFAAYAGAVKVWDANLDLVWEDTGLMLSHKVVMAYNNGVLYVAKGESFEYSYVGDWYNGELENAGVIAYDITNGNILWEYTCDPTQIFVNGSQRGVIDVAYCNGYIVFNTLFELTTEIYILNASDGTLAKYFSDVTGRYTTCAPSVLSGGRWYLAYGAGVRAYQIGTGDYKDWNSYGSYPQQNHNRANADSLQSLAAEITFVGEVVGGEQGGVIVDGIAYYIKNNNCVKFNADTLAVISNFNIHQIYDSTPLMVENLAGEDVLLIKENVNKRVIAINPITGDRIWNSVGDMEGNLFFCMNYFSLSTAVLYNGMEGISNVNALNINFDYCNSLISAAATITSVTSLVGWVTIVNTNIANLNTEGVAVTVAEITVGMTGQQVIDIINNFVIDYAEANS